MKTLKSIGLKGVEKEDIENMNFYFVTTQIHVLGSSEVNSVRFIEGKLEEFP